MKLLAPSSTEVIKALSAISSKRVKMAGSYEAIVSDSKGEHKVKWNPSKNMINSTDENTQKGRFGYPVIAFLMLQGVLPYDPYLASKLSELGGRSVTEDLLKKTLLRWTQPDRQRLMRFTKWILDMLSELELKTEAEITLSDFA